MIKPKALKSGDKVACISLSWGGPYTYPHRFDAGKHQLAEEFELEVVETKYCRKNPEWLLANPQARAEDLMEAFSDNSIKAIFTSIGGDDSIRLIPYTDLNIIKNNPKIFMGYSDTTASHFACYKAGLTSFYGPCIMNGFAENCGMHKYLVDSIRKNLFSSEPIGIVEPNHEGWTVEHYSWAEAENQNIKRKLTHPTGNKFLQGKGKVTGHLLGGCIEVMDMLNGTEHWPSLNDWEGAIMFIETSEDSPDPAFITYWLRNYGVQGILEKINGIILGRPGGQLYPDKIEQYDAPLQQVIRNEFGLTDLPIITQMDFGHTDPMFTIPLGCKAEIDCDAKTFSILESGVTN